MLATANTGKARERFLKNAGEWIGRVEISKKEIPGSTSSMHGYMELNVHSNLLQLIGDGGKWGQVTTRMTRHYGASCVRHLNVSLIARAK